MVRYHFLSALLLASSLSPFAFAQTHSDCNPLKASCPNNPGTKQTSLALDFTKINSLPAEWTTELQGKVNYEPDGAKFIVAKPRDSLNIISKFYVLFGSFEFKLKAARGKGIISTVMLQSDDLDEVDWEIVSTQPDKAQSNYFGKGDTKVYDRGNTHEVENNQNKWHTYRLDWTPEYAEWSTDGKVVRTLRYNEAKGGTRFPQTPMRIKIGAWAAGDPDTNEPGVVEWSGGPTDWNAGPFVMAVESVKIVNYSPAREYAYGDNSGSFKSIKVIDGELMSNGGSAPPVEKPAFPPSAVAPPPPISSLRPTATPSASMTGVLTETTSGSSVGKATSTALPSSSTPARNATATSAKPAVATTNSASFTFPGAEVALSALVLATLLLL